MTEPGGILRSRARNQSNTKACLECQKRKTRCIDVDNSRRCLYCARTNKTCTYSAASARTPLTRKNLEKAEKRCVQLSKLVLSLKPDIDLDAAVAQLESDSPHEPSPTAGTPADDQPQRREHEWREPELSFEPHYEQRSGTLDGMASLPTDKHGAGFLGRSSGSSLYQQVTQLAGLRSSGNAPTGRPSNSRYDRDLPSLRSGFSLSNARMSSTVISTTLVDAYFSCYNTSNPVLDERDFRRSLGRDSGNSRRDPYFGVQYQLVLAIGHWVIGGDESLHASFYHAARAHLSLQCLESGSLSLVQALLLMGNFLQKRDRPNTGYNYIGLAGRIAVGLGLHRETHNDVTQDRGRVQLRRRVLWILFYIESGFALTTGRPCLIDDDAIETPLPANLDDEDVVTVERNKTEVDRPTVCSAMIVQSKLAIIANRLQRDPFASKTVNSEEAAHSIKALEEQLLDWRVQIPAYFYSADVSEWFRGPRAIVMWKEQNLRMIFWRACKRNPNAYLSGEEASRRSYRTALENIREIANFCHDYDDLLHQNICWYATYCSFQAALVLILGQLEERQTASTNTVGTSLPLADGLSQACTCLNVLSSRMAAARRCVSVLESLSRSLNINLSAAPEVSNNGPGTDGSLYANAPGAQNGEAANDPADSSTLGQLNMSTDLALPLDVEQSFDMLFQQMQNFEGDWTTADFGNLNFEV